jgi:FtsP/CotA-like multicopper oxidase with cupredoxin domain
VHREVLLTLDDILLEDGKVAPFSRAETTHSAMGRFGDVLLISGETDLSLGAQCGEVVRFYLTNTANTRVFKVVLPGARMKLVGGDSGRVEHEEFIHDIVIAPSERVVVDVLFEQPGELALEHHTPERAYRLASIQVSEDRAESPLESQFDVLRTNADMVAERQRIVPYLQADPDKVLVFLAEMDMGAQEGEAPTVYSCPMHPEVVSEEPGHCPKCGMKLLPSELLAGARGHEDEGHAHEPETHHNRDHSHGDAGHEGAAAGGIEWEDDMVEINRMTTPSNMRWKIIDRETDAENMAIDWRFRVGDQVKIRLVNEIGGDHPMHHPFHVHGAGRFLVLSRDGVVEPNLVWKDTVLVRTGETVDILLDITNVGRWMAHCHIAEHHESGMMFSFDVAPADDG